VTFAVARVIYGFRSRRRYLFLLPAGFIGLSRVACGAHFPLDGGRRLLGAGVAQARLQPFHGLAA
jgi:membrane-associated phospholipid phosphatase